MHLEKEGWLTATEAESKEWEEQRKLRDKISAEMGQYLLKGYKMLDKTCKVCYTILLQSKKGQNFCILCEEISPSQNVKQVHIPQQAASISPPKSQQQSGPLDGADVPAPCSERDHRSTIGYVKEVIVSKMQWAGKELSTSTSIETSIQLGILIKGLADALASVARAEQM
jgi:uncharacterized Zn finger protein (UPF0148 family)